MILYGIPNCDTVKKARAWLAAQGLAYQFHDYRKSGIERATLQAWMEKVGWELLLNRAGTTFRGLPDAAKQALNAPKALALMLEHPSLIKRPVLVSGQTLLVGFSPEKYAALK